MNNLEVNNINSESSLHKLLQSSSWSDEYSNRIMKILNEGADVNAKDNDDRSPLYYSLKNHSVSVEVIKELIKHGASCTERYPDGDTPLHYALLYRKPLEVIQLILKHGGEVNAANDNKETPIFLLCVCPTDNFDIFKELFRHGASVTIKNNIGETPLLIAVRNNKGLEVIEELLKHGADPNATDYGSWNPLSVIPDLSIDVYLMTLTNWGASIHNSLSVFNLLDMCDDDHDENVVEEYVKYALIEHPDDIVCDYCESMSEIFLQNVQCYKTELEVMKNTCVDKEFTLYDFIIKKYDYGEVFPEKGDICKNRDFVNELVTKFPIYQKVLLSRLCTRSYYLRYFFNINFYIKTGNKVICLNSYCLQIIGKYLSNEDLKNATCAFSTQYS